MEWVESSTAAVRAPAGRRDRELESTGPRALWQSDPERSGCILFALSSVATARAGSADLTVLFVCEHGSAKSTVAAAHFDRLAAERGLAARAISRGTSPDAELAPAARRDSRRTASRPRPSCPARSPNRTSTPRIGRSRLSSSPSFVSPGSVERWEVPAISDETRLPGTPSSGDSKRSSTTWLRGSSATSSASFADGTEAWRPGLAAPISVARVGCPKRGGSRSTEPSRLSAIRRARGFWRGGSVSSLPRRPSGGRRWRRGRRGRRTSRRRWRPGASRGSA